MAHATAVLQAERESGSVAQLGDGGGLKGKIKASRTPINAPKARPASVWAECSSPLRSDQSLRCDKTERRVLAPDPKLKPAH